MSFVSTLKAITNKVNSIAKEMDKKVETFADEVLSIITDFDEEFFTRERDEELANEARVDMKAAIIKLFDMFQAEDKKPKNINGYILFCKETREECLRRNIGSSPIEISKALGLEWKALDKEERDEYTTRAKDVAPQTEEEKKAKKSASKKPSQQVTCDYVGCNKVVKTPTQHTDGCTYCANHFKKVVSDEKKASTPKCKHVGKEGKACSSDAINEEWCSRHMKKSSPTVSPVVAPVAKLEAEKKDDKASKKSTSKKTEEPKSAKDSVKEKLAEAEKKMAEAKAKSSPVVSAQVSPKSFNFKTEKPVKMTDNPEYWACAGIRFDGVNKSRLHKKTGLVLHLDNKVLEGMFVDGKKVNLENVSEEIKTWVKNCGISTGDEDDEDMDMELDEELESEDEE